MAVTKKQVFNQIKKIFLIIVGSLMLSVATSIFYVPNNIVSGGMSGLGVIFKNAFNWDPNLIITIATWSCFFIGFIFLGKKFALKTLCSTIVYPLGSYLFTFIYENNQSFLSVGSTAGGILLAAIFGGIFTGVGCGLTFLGGGSTGGVDIPALIAQKYFKIRVSYISFSIDCTIILSGFIASLISFNQNPIDPSSLSPLVLSLIGIVAAFLQSFMMDKVFLGTKKSYIAYIISSKYNEINEFIIDRMDRGATIMNVEGGYSHQDLKMIKVCFDFNEYSLLKDSLDKIDPNAFVSVVKAHEIHGLGFENKSELFDDTGLDNWIKKNKKNKEK